MYNEIKYTKLSCLSLKPTSRIIKLKCDIKTGNKGTCKNILFPEATEFQNLQNCQRQIHIHNKF